MVFESRQKDQKPSNVVGNSRYRSADIAKLLKEAAKKEGLSVGMYQKQLVYRDLEKKFGKRFIEALKKDPAQDWEVAKEFLGKLLR